VQNLKLYKCTKRLGFKNLCSKSRIPARDKQTTTTSSPVYNSTPAGAHEGSSNQQTQNDSSIKFPTPNCYTFTAVWPLYISILAQFFFTAAYFVFKSKFCTTYCQNCTSQPEENKLVKNDGRDGFVMVENDMYGTIQ
jgi:hypothetical protein